MQTALQPFLRELPQKLLLEGNTSVLEGKLGFLVIQCCVFVHLCSCLLPQGEEGDKHQLFFHSELLPWLPLSSAALMNIPDPCGIQGTPAQLLEEV